MEKTACIQNFDVMYCMVESCDNVKLEKVVAKLPKSKPYLLVEIVSLVMTLFELNTFNSVT